MVVNPPAHLHAAIDRSRAPWRNSIISQIVCCPAADPDTIIGSPSPALLKCRSRTGNYRRPPTLRHASVSELDSTTTTLERRAKLQSSPQISLFRSASLATISLSPPRPSRITSFERPVNTRPQSDSPNCPPPPPHENLIRPITSARSPPP